MERAVERAAAGEDTGQQRQRVGDCIIEDVFGDVWDVNQDHHLLLLLSGQRERGGERVSSREVPLPMQLLQRGAICDLLPESGWEDNLAWWGRRGDGGELLWHTVKAELQPAHRAVHSRL